jgi:HemX protein
MAMEYRLIDLMIAIYALSLVVFFADFLEKNGKARWMGTGLLVLVWAMQAGFFVSRLLSTGYFPLITMFETLFFFSWVVVTLALLLSIWFRQEIVVYLLGFLGFFLMVCALLDDPGRLPIPSGWSEGSRLLVIHIVLGIASYALLSISAIFSGLYLFLHARLKSKIWSAFLGRLPSLERMERYAFRTVLAGGVLMVVTLLLGIVWIMTENNPALLLDPKSLTSILLLGAYSMYIMQRLGFKADGRRLAYWNIGSCAVIAANFAVSYGISNFNDWVWM